MLGEAAGQLVLSPADGVERVLRGELGDLAAQALQLLPRRVVAAPVERGGDRLQTVIDAVELRLQPGAGRVGGDGGAQRGELLAELLEAAVHVAAHLGVHAPDLSRDRAGEAALGLGGRLRADGWLRADGRLRRDGGRLGGAGGGGRGRRAFGGQ